MLHVRLDTDLLARLKEKAAADNRTLNGYVRVLLLKAAAAKK